MKICPTCKETYNDDELNFCLSDGTTLLTKKGGKGAKGSRINEVVSVALVALALLIFLCLMTASPDDRSVFSTGYSTTSSTKNWIGIVGSNVAAILIGLLGWVAYLLPALIALIAWRVYQSANLKLRALRVIGYVLFLGGLSGLLYMIDPSYGGVIGGAFPYLAMKLIGSIGTAIVLGAMFVASLLLITDISFNWLFGHVDIAKDNFKIHASEYLEKRRLAKAALAGNETPEPESKITKRRKKALTDSPTISIPDTIVSAAGAPKTGDILVPATTQLDAGNETVLELPLEEVPIPPTIAIDDGAAFPSGPLAEIPITPVKHTGELNGEDPVEEDPEEDESPFKMPSQTYEGYRLPSPQLLHLPQPHIQHKDKELIAIAESLAEKTKEFNVAGKVVNISPGPVVTTYEF
ncbi:MAG: DNA translocase FtsK 4TM domain-containing protein, partial [Pyrinomonadaceae bacterium]